MDLTSLSKYLILSGIMLIFVGVLLYLSSKAGISIGKLPGDIFIQKNNFTFYFPLATSIIVSIVITLILNLIFKR